MQEILESLKILAVAVGLHILLGTFNNILHKKFKFSWTWMWYGVGKALVFTLCIVGLAYIFEKTDILPSDIAPSLIIEAGVLFYGVKVAMGLKELLFPGGEVEGKSFHQIRNDLFEEVKAGAVRDAELTAITKAENQARKAGTPMSQKEVAEASAMAIAQQDLTEHPDSLPYDAEVGIQPTYLSSEAPSVEEQFEDFSLSEFYDDSEMGDLPSDTGSTVTPIGSESA